MMSKNHWHSRKITEVFQILKTNKQGLSNQEAVQRLKTYGLNVLPDESKQSKPAILLRQLESPLIYILLAAAVVTFVLGELMDMSVILLSVVINTTVGFWQELKSDQAFALLKSMVQHKARILRDGLETEIDAARVVLGDVIILSAGSRIPADARLLEAYNFETNEAALTGESMPVAKSVKNLPSSSAITEKINMVFQGTTVSKGKALAVVVETGMSTAFGEIAFLMNKTKDPATPLQKQLGWLAKVLGVVALVVTVAIFGAGVIQGRSIVGIFLTAVAVAVAAIPEGLVISLTVILAIGMRSLAKSKAIVKRLIATETLGSVSVICSDKTGTLTTGEMSVVEIVAWSKKGLSFTETGKVLEIAVIGNEAVVSNAQISGDPTSKALLAAGINAGLNPAKLNKAFPKIDEVPFDTEYKWAATLHRCGKDEQILYVRGAPENLIKNSKFLFVSGLIKTFSKQQKQVLLGQLEGMARKGERVVGAAYRQQPKTSQSLLALKKDGSLLNDLVFVGLLGLKDPLRKEAKATITLAARAGIRTIMITGDHAHTAVTIGKELGLGDEAISGEEIEKMKDEEFQEKIKTINIFARVLPKHKVRIIEALRAIGETVAMTGDGVNDAPALKAADIGVAVGAGTDVAKEAADVVLTDNNFKTIVEAVREGRNIYENIRKVVAYLLSGSLDEIVVIGGSLLLGLPLPLAVTQILWVNLIEDSLPNIALAFDPGEKDIMRERPRKRSDKLLGRELKILVSSVGFVTSFMVLGLYLYLLKEGYDLTYIRTMVFIGIGTNSLLYIYSIRSLRHFIWQINPFNNKFLLFSTVFGIGLLLAAVYAPPLQILLHTTSIKLADWVPLAGMALAAVVLIEVIKGIFIIKPHQNE